MYESLNMDTKTVTGILTRTGDSTFLLDDRGTRHFESDLIWDGYLTHWTGQKLHGRHLEQRDYTYGKPIVILWPDTVRDDAPHVDLYFNERLVKYAASLLGHVAISINGSIFNFSHKLNENEIMKPEEYFFRPALGEFAPHPLTMTFDASDPARPYYDKFGRLFMRTIHVLRIHGINTGALREIFNRELNLIHSSAGDRGYSEKYSEFNIFTRSCATIIRDGLREYGFEQVKGIFPRDFFVDASYSFLKNAKQRGLEVSRFTLHQLKVPEAPYSAMSPLLNPRNIIRTKKLSRL